jgi:nucleoside-diphosphate-sugar epimerase
MHVFLTGASGWVGSAVAEDLLAAGHQVTGLVRNAEKAQALVALGAQVVTGTLDDHQLLHNGAAVRMRLSIPPLTMIFHALARIARRMSAPSRFWGRRYAVATVLCW